MEREDDRRLDEERVAAGRGHVGGTRERREKVKKKPSSSSSL